MLINKISLKNLVKPLPESFLWPVMKVPAFLRSNNIPREILLMRENSLSLRAQGRYKDIFL